MSRLTGTFRDVASSLLDEAANLNRLDAYAGDGDLGVTMSAAARAVLGLLSDLETSSTEEVLGVCGKALAREAPSTSGTLLATGLLHASRVPREPNESDAGTFARMLDAAYKGIAERGKAGPGAKTMLDALAPAVIAAAKAAGNELSLALSVAAAAEAADEGAKATKDMVPRHGRAGWLAERSVGHEDAGARLVASMLERASQSLRAGGRL